MNSFLYWWNILDKKLTQLRLTVFIFFYNKNWLNFLNRKELIFYRTILPKFDEIQQKYYSKNKNKSSNDTKSAEKSILS